MIGFRAWHLRFVVCLPILLSSLSVSSGQDPLGQIRDYPPNMLAKDEIRIAIASMDWQLKREEVIQQVYRQRREQITDRLKAFEDQMEQLKSTIPASVRFLDTHGRSSVADRATERLLEAKLELVSLETRIHQLELAMNKEKNEPTDKLRVMELESEVKTALLNLQAAKSEFDHTRNLAEKKFTSSQDLERDKIAMEIAEAQYELARQKSRISSSSTEIAKQLSDARVELAPIRAKIETLDQFLRQLFEASETFARVKRLQREHELWQKELATVADALAKSSKTSTELLAFKQLIQQERGKIDNDGDEE